MPLYGHVWGEWGGVDKVIFHVCVGLYTHVLYQSLSKCSYSTCDWAIGAIQVLCNTFF